ALASTYETAVRGVIYDHRPASLPAERLLAALKPMVAEAGKGGGSVFERDAAIVLRRLGDAAKAARSADEPNRRAFLDLLRRVVRRPDARSDRELPERGDAASRLIVP